MDTMEEDAQQPLLPETTSQHPRLFRADISAETHCVSFKGKDCPLSLQVTAFGDVLVRVTDWVSLFTGHEQKPAVDHFGNIARAYPELHHGDRKLQDHLQVVSNHFRTLLEPFSNPFLTRFEPVSNPFRTRF